MITRRTLLRQYLMRPDDQVTQVWLYSLAVSAQRHHIDVHGFTLMSTHEHLTASDPRGVMGHFLRDFHRTVANAMKALLHMDGNFWEDAPSSVVHLRTTQAFIEKSGYVVANPVAALAVPHSRQWPGAIVHADQIGNKRITVRRPDAYFDPKTKQWPATVTLDLTMPDLGDYSDHEARERIAQEAERLEDEARRNARAEGKTFMGVKQVKLVSRFKRATKAESHRELNPTFAVGRSNREALAVAALAVREFRRLYRTALNAWREKLRDVLFPAGTFVMRWLHAANIAPT